MLPETKYQHVSD